MTNTDIKDGGLPTQVSIPTPPSCCVYGCRQPASPIPWVPRLWPLRLEIPICAFHRDYVEHLVLVDPDQLCDEDEGLARGLRGDV